MVEISVNNNEYQIQKVFHEWCKKQPFVLTSWHCPNGFTSNAKQGFFMKQIGLLKGVYDYWVIINKPAILAIEFKKQGGTISKEQIEFGKVLEKANIPHKVCYSAFEATQFVKKIMEE